MLMTHRSIWRIISYKTKKKKLESLKRKDCQFEILKNKCSRDPRSEEDNREKSFDFSCDLIPTFYSIIN